MGRVTYFVVGDKKLDSGNGTYVKNLEEMKKKLLKMKPTDEWRLVISIHGAEDVISTRGGNLKKRNVQGVYGADELKALFVDDADFAKWRKKYGPTWTTLNACQVHLPFEKVILESFNGPESKQSAQGLGKGCRPATETVSYYPAKGRTAVTTWSQWRKLSKQEQKDLKAMLVELNKKFGYFGGPPVDETEVLKYYFDEAPKGGWPQVTVSYNRADTGIGFYNRTQNTRFLTEKCTQHLGPMRGHTATAPPAP
jgi:hypothetical protein